MVTTGQKLGARIRMLRERLSMTQEQLAERAQTSNQYVSSLERGLQNITLETLERIANALKVDLVSLFSFDSKNDKISKQAIKKLIDDLGEESFQKVGGIISLLFK